MDEKIKDWMRDHMYAEDDIVLGGQGLTDMQCDALAELFDVIDPDWRDIFRELPGGSQEAV